MLKYHRIFHSALAFVYPHFREMVCGRGKQPTAEQVSRVVNSQDIARMPLMEEVLKSGQDFEFFDVFHHDGSDPMAIPKGSELPIPVIREHGAGI